MSRTRPQATEVRFVEHDRGAAFPEILRFLREWSQSQPGVGGKCPESAEVGSARLGELIDHADRLVGVVRASRAETGKQAGCVLVVEVWVLVKEEPPPIHNIGGVDDPPPKWSS